MKLPVCLLIAASLAANAQVKPTPPPTKPSAAPGIPKFPPFEQTLTDPVLFTKPLESVMTAYQFQVTAAQKDMMEKMRARMKERGVTMPDKDPSAFQWLSDKKDGLRADPQMIELFGQKVGEVIIRGDATGKVGPITVSIYNRGDDGDLSTPEMNTRLKAWQDKISAALGVQPEAHDQRGTVILTGQMWRKGHTAWLLESSTGKGAESARAEFARLRIASTDTAASGGVARRSSLTDHVTHKDNGDVYLDGVPMVDQGQKGYCAVASAERVVRYYGLDVDQHEMAEIANTGSMGTSMPEMEAALKKATGKLQVKTIKQFDLDQREYEQDVRSYNQAAKKANEKEFYYDRKVAMVNPLQFWAEVKPDLFLQVKTAQPGFARYNGKIEEYINQGIPLCWALQLGMFKETGIPQTHGGHMRLIIGYNKKTNEILYTDSWGKGHELKRMPAGQAWCMSMALFTMVPTR